MRKTAFAFVSAFLILALPLSAQSKSSAKADAGGKTKMALLFHFEDLVSTVSPYDDGFQTGAGFKYWVNDKIGARALLSMLVEPDAAAETSTTTLGFSIAGEYHLRPGRVSPYFGGIAGCKMLMEESGNFLDYSIGAIGGVEVMIFQNFALYGEYQALAVNDIEGFGFRLGDRAILGFAIYF